MREIVTDSLERSFFGPRFQLASDAEQRYLAAMAALGEPRYRSSEVPTSYGARDARGVSVFRESLIQKGLIWSPRNVAAVFVVVAAAAVTGSPWLLVLGLGGHGLKDLWQHPSQFVANTR